ncbi:mitochondrial fission 1 protein-like [Callorhinchus milii]|uniref:Mitochondrial fission 1 protein n=1 Tax=Callorhinchus milii TaxID=7868 RepID=K4FTI3_CALMI|nr:mitochondrial fission 1 protein [Callorhinchus milii]AFK10664.1 mitochondrial fission 1 protein-like protein [Callorhinchus milii]|eukprot:gi/632988230/ref/XP_007882994.1/ PREDICTED: mitochondrial fission 1 protein-like [Callorhinchus milii]
MEAVVNEIVSPEDLLKFERKYNAEVKQGKVSKASEFEYAWCLIRSRYPDDIKRGIVILEELFPKGSQEEQRDYIFYLAVGNYRLKEYEEALKCIRTMLKNEPKNQQALEMEKLIEKKMHRDGLVGMAIVGTVAAAGIAGVAGLIGLAISRGKS